MDLSGIMARGSSIRKQLKSGKGIFEYIRSVIASQISGYTDLAFSFICFAFLGLNSALSSFLGAASGGIVNCIINYRFTFKSDDKSYMVIGVKFFIVWVGSLLLNTFGTKIFDSFLEHLNDIFDYGYSKDLCFIVARIFVSLVVSVFWNFLLQRNFVFRKNRVDPYIQKGVDKLLHKKRK